jgi:hypothetical protein
MGVPVTVWVCVSVCAYFVGRGGGGAYAAGEENAIDSDTFRRCNLAGEQAGNGGRKTHGFIDTGLEVMTVRELLPAHNLVRAAEHAADLLLQRGELRRVAEQVEECCRERGCGGVGAAVYQ